MNNFNLKQAASTTIMVAICLAFGLSGCGNCEDGAGEVVRTDRTLGAFTGVEVAGSLDVVLHTDGQQGVSVEGQPNLIELVTTEVHNGVLKLGTTKCTLTNRTLVVHISQPSLDLVRVMGSGNITGDGVLRSTELALEVQGSGDIELNVAVVKLKASVDGSGDIKVIGDCSELEAEVTGSGDISASELRASDAKAQVTGSGNIRLVALSKLDAEVTGSGDITYRGDPLLKKEITGSGDIKHE